MEAFISSGFVLNRRWRTSICKTPVGKGTTWRRARRNDSFMLSEPVSGGQSSEASSSLTPEQSTSEPPPEPYPGYFDDMRRMGLSDEQAYAQAAKARAQANPVASNKVGGAKNLYKEDGTPYAPWMSGVIESPDAAVIKSRTDAKGKLAADPQRAELSGVGVSWKMLGDELELKWSTGNEEGNLGFVVSRRQGKTDSWEKVCDYTEAPSELASKGVEGGTYSFIVPDPIPGSWVYRISDVDSKGNVSDLSQTLIEIESEQDERTQKLALAVLVIVLLLALFAGLSLDPLSSTG